MPITIVMPRLTIETTEGTLVKWIKRVGDTVAVGDVLAIVGSGKATMEVQASDEGVLREIYVEDGEKAQVGQRVALLIRKGEATKVFIVHGHHDALTYELSHHLLREKLETIILREELNEGRTIPEKLADFASEAGFAVVLFTGDDEGRNRGASSFQPRARQNVVFEMGLFIGLLGRKKVCAVFDPGVELPSDLQGIARIEYDTVGKWKYDVVREIKKALKLLH